MAQIADQGVSFELPPGWEAEFIRRAPDLAPLGTSTPEETYAVVHIANWPMPTERGDFGSGAVEVMRSGDVLVILAEYGPENLGTALFKRVGVPWPLDTADFDQNRLQRPLPGQGDSNSSSPNQTGRSACTWCSAISETATAIGRQRSTPSSKR